MKTTRPQIPSRHLNPCGESQATARRWRAGGVLASILALLPAASLDAADVAVPRLIDASVEWTADNVYFLEGPTFVVTPPGAETATVLRIEPGTVIKARNVEPSSNFPSLVVTRGAQIQAEGTATAPIIFTSELDEPTGSLGPDDFGLWGGLVLLGRARINSRWNGEPWPAPIEDEVFGLYPAVDEQELVRFGGEVDADSSGVLRYVSIRHGSAGRGGATTFGLVLGGVGRGTELEFVEVFASTEHGFLFQGGTVEVRHLAAVYCDPVGFVFRQGWRGTGQYLFSLAPKSFGLSWRDGAGGARHDGIDGAFGTPPVSHSVFHNVTFLGGGSDNLINAVQVRDHASVSYHNSIFSEFVTMLDIENDALYEDGNQPVTAEWLRFSDNLWWSHQAANNTPAGLNAHPNGLNAPYVAEVFESAQWANAIAEPQLRGISYQADGRLDPRPAPDSPALEPPFAQPKVEGIAATAFKGAFSPDYLWLLGWSKLATDGYLAAADSWFPHPKLGWIYLREIDPHAPQWAYSLQLGRWIWIYGGNADWVTIGAP